MEKQEHTKKEIFTVPEGYFEQLNRNIMDATVNGNITIQRRKNIFERVTSYAAAIAVLFVLAINVFKPGSNAYSEKVAMSAEEEYIDNILNSYTIDDYTFYCYLTNSDFE